MDCSKTLGFAMGIMTRIQKSLLRELEEKSCDLRCRNVPTGGDDYRVEWFVIEHHIGEPKEREIGFGEDPTEAMMAAFHGIGYSDLGFTEVG